MCHSLAVMLMHFATGNEASASTADCLAVEPTLSLSTQQLNLVENKSRFNQKPLISSKFGNL